MINIYSKIKFLFVSSLLSLQVCYACDDLTQLANEFDETFKLRINKLAITHDEEYIPHGYFDLHRVPHNIKIHLFSFLNKRDVKNVTAVSQSFKAAMEDNDLWQIYCDRTGLIIHSRIDVKNLKQHY